MADIEKSKVELLIEQMVQEKTFSLDAITSVKKLQEAAGLQRARLAQLETDLQTSDKRISELTKANAALKELVDKISTREQTVAVREAAVTKLEMERAVAMAESKIFGLCFDKVFANRQLRESVIENSNRAIANPNSNYPTTMPENNNVTRTTEQG